MFEGDAAGWTQPWTSVSEWRADGGDGDKPYAGTCKFHVRNPPDPGAGTDPAGIDREELGSNEDAMEEDRWQRSPAGGFDGGCPAGLRTRLSNCLRSRGLLVSSFGAGRCPRNSPARRLGWSRRMGLQESEGAGDGRNCGAGRFAHLWQLRTDAGSMAAGSRKADRKECL